jgi:hypothetical protein
MAHDPARLATVGRFPKRGGRSLGGRRWNVWYWHLRCPECGREFVRLTNPLRGREVRCVGTDRLRVRKREAD